MKTSQQERRAHSSFSLIILSSEHVVSLATGLYHLVVVSNQPEWQVLLLDQGSSGSLTCVL